VFILAVEEFGKPEAIAADIVCQGSLVDVEGAGRDGGPMLCKREGDVERVEPAVILTGARDEGRDVEVEELLERLLLFEMTTDDLRRGWKEREIGEVRSELRSRMYCRISAIWEYEGMDDVDEDGCGK
jgi:hypothetical protein